MPASTETARAPGLRSPAEILVDRWGIPHLYAASDEDAFFAQGWNAARDRLWQIDLWRKRGLGLLAGDFGPAYVEKDRAARLFLYRGDMAAEWAAYGADARRRTEAFAAGINAYVDLVELEPARLPPEFSLTGTRPQRWAAEDVVRIRSHARVQNLEHEVRRLAVVAEHGTEADGMRKRLQPAHEIRVPDGLVLEAAPPEVQRTYLLATEWPAFGAGQSTLVSAEPGGLFGSNAWALRPERTTTGRAVMASDPHRVHLQPSLRYIVHLNAPGLNVVGAGEPGVPGVSFGHNERISFGLTIWYPDQEDLHVYELNADDPDLYRYGDGWERMTVERQSVPVRGDGAREVELRFTRHGPVLHVDRERRRAYALRTVWSEPGTAAYLASLRALTARSWNDYLSMLRHWGAPSSNHIVADVDGNIGWANAGMVPVRANWDGLLPVPGDGRYEWAGFLDPDAKPRWHNPPHGWVATANQFNLPDGMGEEPPIGFEWPDPTRHRVIAEALEARDRHSLDDMRALQTSYASGPAQRILPLLRGLRDDPAIAAARGLLDGWNCRLDAGSAAAALFEVWMTRHLVPGVLAAASPPGVQAHAAAPDTALAVDLVGIGDRRLGGPAGRDALLARTLAAAWADTAGMLGPDPRDWAWGKLHHGYFEHPLSPLVDAATRAKLDVGPLPKGGSGLTVNNNNHRATDFRVTQGVTWRMVCDVGNWDNCWTINCPGQSGDPRSPHYRDLFPLWARDEYVPMLFSRAAIERETVLRIALVP